MKAVARCAFVALWPMLAAVAVAAAILAREGRTSHEIALAAPGVKQPGTASGSRPAPPADNGIAA